MDKATADNLTKRYREQGWWTGERLEQRYRNSVLQRPDALAVADCGGSELSHNDLWQRSGELSDELARQGISAGAIVMLFLPNTVDWQVALLAVLRQRATPASIPTKTDARTLAYAADLIRCQVILTADEQNGGRLISTVHAATQQMSGAPGILRIAANGGPSWLRRPVSGQGSLPETNIDHVMFTSSTTGLPKAVTHSSDTLGALNILFTERFSLGPDAAIFMGSPLGHSVGGIHGARLALHTGAALVLQERWCPARAMGLIDKYDCRFTAAATPFLKDLLDHAEADSSSKNTPLRSFLCGGAPVPPAMLEQAAVRFPHTFVTNLWGMTEGGLVTCVRESPKEKMTKTAGIGLPGLELRVLDDAGEDVPSGDEGELAMRGPGVFTGYFGQEDLYRSLLTTDGFFRTGDLARIDHDGYVQITGRLKDLIIRGGVNISPLPIEDALASHPKLDSVAVVGFPDDRLGERICAVVVAKEEKPTLDELIQFAAAAGLEKRQLPEVVRYVDVMPRTAAGKIRKPDLQSLINDVGIDQSDLSRKQC